MGVIIYCIVSRSKYFFIKIALACCFSADLYDDEEILPVLSYSAWWQEEGYHKVAFTEEEQEVLQRLPRKEYLVNEKEKDAILLGEWV